MAGKRGTFEERLWSYVDKRGDCWTWSGHLQNGYGYIWSGGSRGTMRRAHGAVYELLVGPVPAGKELDHLCRNRACVNPAHMEPVSRRENLMRSPIAFASVNARKTHCPQGHQLAGENLKVNAAGGRMCRTCRRESSLRYYYANKGRAS